MEKAKQWISLSVLAAMVVLAGGWFLLVTPERSEAEVLREQLDAQEVTNAQLAAQLEVLQDKAERLPEQEAAIARVAEKLPDGAQLPELVRALTEAARSSGVQLVSVVPGTMVSLAAEPPAPAPAAETEVDPAQTAAAPPAAAKPALSAVPLTIAVVGTYFDVEEFVAQLEELPRALRITSLEVSPGSGPTGPDSSSPAEDGRSMAATLTGSVFVAAAAGAGTAVPPAPVAQSDPPGGASAVPPPASVR